MGYFVRLITVLGLAALVGCGPVTNLVAGAGVTPLAKAEGWRDDLGPMLPPFGILEIAYDRPTAEQLWADNVPEGLPEHQGDPEEPGIYGGHDEVDFDRQVVVVWSSGESSTCPGWLADVQVDDAGTVQLEREDAAGVFGACTDDYNPYRLVGAVDRDRVPPPGALPTEDVAGVPEGPGAVVAEYPVTDR
jgi:hypothetical protein